VEKRLFLFSILCGRLLTLIEQYRAVWLSRYLPGGMQAASLFTSLFIFLLFSPQEGLAFVGVHIKLIFEGKVVFPSLSETDSENRFWGEV
jgi:hypothetical protein